MCKFSTGMLTGAMIGAGMTMLMDKKAAKKAKKMFRRCICYMPW